MYYSITEVNVSKYKVRVFRKLGKELLMGPDVEVRNKLRVINTYPVTPQTIVNGLKDLMDIARIEITFAPFDHGVFVDLETPKKEDFSHEPRNS